MHFYPECYVKAVQPQNDYTLIITFATGEKKLYDCKPLLSYPAFQPLQNLDLFFKAHVKYDTVVWNDKLDIAPESLYENGIPIE